MNGTRLIWRRAHPVRLRNRMDTQPHLELIEAYQRDQYNAELSERLAQELERDLRREYDEAV